MPNKGPLSWLNSTGFERSEVRDFWALDEHDIPPSPGAYVLIAKKGTRFLYPMGVSPVFYIGQSRNLKGRLELHLKYACEATQKDRPENLYWPRYEYAAKFGCRYVYLRTRQGMTAKGLEDLVLAHFARRYLAFPVANETGGWKKVKKVFQQQVSA